MRLKLDFNSGKSLVNYTTDHLSDLFDIIIITKQCSPYKVNMISNINIMNILLIYHIIIWRLY